MSPGIVLNLAEIHEDVGLVGSQLGVETLFGQFAAVAQVLQPADVVAEDHEPIHIAGEPLRL